MFAWLNRAKSEVKIEAEKPNIPRVVYRYELTKKKTPVKKSVQFANSAPTILGEEKKEDFVGKTISENKEGESSRIRVKVKMTKEEAARLLSKCKEGGVLEFKDVARELVLIPVNRVSLVSPCTNSL